MKELIVFLIICAVILSAGDRMIQLNNKGIRVYTGELEQEKEELKRFYEATLSFVDSLEKKLESGL